MEVDTFEWQPFLTSLEVVTKNNPFGKLCFVGSQ